MSKTSRVKRWMTIEYIRGNHKRCLGIFKEKREADNCRYEHCKDHDSKVIVESINFDMDTKGTIISTGYTRDIDFNTYLPKQKFA